MRNMRIASSAVVHESMQKEPPFLTKLSAKPCCHRMLLCSPSLLILVDTLVPWPQLFFLVDEVVLQLSFRSVKTDPPQTSLQNRSFYNCVQPRTWFLLVSLTMQMPVGVVTCLIPFGLLEVTLAQHLVNGLLKHWVSICAKLLLTISVVPFHAAFLWRAPARQWLQHFKIPNRRILLVPILSAVPQFLRRFLLWPPLLPRDLRCFIPHDSDGFHLYLHSSNLHKEKKCRTF